LIAQVGLALVLLIASDFDVAHLSNAHQRGSGFQDPEAVQLTHIVIPRGPTFDAHSAQDLRQMVEAAEALPGVTAAAYASAAAGKWFHTYLSIWKDSPPKASFPPTPREVHLSSILPDARRAPSDRADWNGWTSVTTVRRAGLGKKPGKKKSGVRRGSVRETRATNPSDPWREIVGVVGDVHDSGLKPAEHSHGLLSILDESSGTIPTMLWGIGTLLLRTPRAGTGDVGAEMRLRSGV